MFFAHRSRGVGPGWKRSGTFGARHPPRQIQRIANTVPTIDTAVLFPFDASLVKPCLALFCLALVGCASESPQPYQVKNPAPLPIALDQRFEFRKTKEYFLDPMAPKFDAKTDPSVAFERYYRTYGAITALDTRDRLGVYLDFFWRAPKNSDVRVRLEYRQEKLHAFVQAREVHYPQAKSHNQTEFAIIGDDFADDGRVTAWQALLIVNDRVVALTRSYLWR